MEYEKEQAFINAVRDRREQMYRIALGYLRNSQDAEDAVSDAVEATWKSLKRIRNADALPAYLIRCTINAARYQLRIRRNPLNNFQNFLLRVNQGIRSLIISRE